MIFIGSALFSYDNSTQLSQMAISAQLWLHIKFKVKNWESHQIPNQFSEFSPLERCPSAACSEKLRRCLHFFELGFQLSGFHNRSAHATASMADKIGLERSECSRSSRC